MQELRRPRRADSPSHPALRKISSTSTRERAKYPTRSGTGGDAFSPGSFPTSFRLANRKVNLIGKEECWNEYTNQPNEKNALTLALPLAALYIGRCLLCAFAASASDLPRRLLRDPNTVLGENALLNNTGLSNTAIGFAALFSNTTAIGNTATGYDALYFNTTGSDNTANGTAALFSNNGGANTATGFSALYSNTTGGSNTATGAIAKKIFRARFDFLRHYCFEIAGPPRRTYFWTLPVAVFGSSGKNVIPFGALKCAR